MITQEDLECMITCNIVGERLYPFHKVWYYLKTRILNELGEFVGYDRQTWEDKDYFHEGELYAVHSHILEVWALKAGSISEHIFHIPTNEYDYWVNFSDIQKQSEHYKDFLPFIRKTIDGKKKFRYDNRDIENAFRSLKFLLRKYSYLLME
jgi:hypothetical protein